MLGYKSAWRGGRLVTADRFYPSSKKCSGCGAVKTKLPLSERTYTCDSCGLVTDRDVNAARNLLLLAASGAESLNAREGTVRPHTARHAPPNLEPGTPPGDKTGTAARQQAAAA
jgi:putative transposase